MKHTKHSMEYYQCKRGYKHLINVTYCLYYRTRIVLSIGKNLTEEIYIFRECGKNVAYVVINTINIGYIENDNSKWNEE